MSAPAFDPYLHETRLHWRNRWERWRSDLAQSVFHAGALLLLAALLVWPALQSAAVLRVATRALWSAWPWLLALATLALALLGQRRALGSRRLGRQRHWLQAQPIASTIERRDARRGIVREAAMQGAVGAGALVFLDAPALAFPALLGLVLLAAALAPVTLRRSGTSGRLKVAAVRIHDAGRGRIWRWQRIETRAALGGRALAVGVWGLLLVPMGSGPGGALAVAIAGLLLASLGNAWQRTLSVLPAAHAWLAPQPLPGRALLQRSLALPATLAALAMALLAGLLLALGTPMLALAAALGLAAIASLHFGCAFAERSQPRRIGLALALHLAWLLALLQALSPLAALSWPLQLAWLLRRGWRP